MSLISMYNAHVMAGRKRKRPKRTASGTRNFTIESIMRESPACMSISKNLGIRVRGLLVAENYRYIIPKVKGDKRLKKVEERMENYDYLVNCEIFLLKQAANRIEDDISYTLFYYKMDDEKFKDFKANTLKEFYELKDSVDLELKRLWEEKKIKSSEKK